MALVLLPAFVMSDHQEKPADLMQTDRCCWGWWRIHSQQHHSVFAAVYPSYFWQMQRDQLSRDSPIWPPSSFTVRLQDLLHFYSSLFNSNSYPFCQFQCALIVRGLEQAQWWTPQITLPDVATFNTQSRQCLTAFLSVSVVVRFC